MLKPHWDPSKSAVLNLQNMGIGQPKGLVEKKEQKDGASDAENNNPCKAIEVFDIPDSDIIIPSRRERFPLNEDEERYIVDCMSKYGDDYTKIFRDTKVNYLQHTEDKLRKMGARFLLLQSQQRRITDFPDKVKTLIEGKGAIK